MHCPANIEGCEGFVTAADTFDTAVYACEHATSAEPAPMVEDSLVERIRAAAAAAKLVRLDSSCSCLSFHHATLDQAAELVAAGYRPDVNTREMFYESGPRTYFVLTAVIDGVSITVFTDNRPATAAEIEAVAPREVAPVVEVRAPTPAPAADPAPAPEPAYESRWSLLELQ